MSGVITKNPENSSLSLQMTVDPLFEVDAIRAGR
jgi:hypothetical protein